ncbi:MAG TPA: hypothetical protein VLT16_03280 [Candidatus Limnocylindrales bacterium]|nr:hypothetical protein [Candidatus Limnocylindrales bacterium]
MQKAYKDDWGTGAREGYEDRGAYRPLRVAQKEPGSPLLRTLGAICIFGGLCWGAYLYTQGGDIALALQQNHGPVAILGLGAVCSLLGKFIRG